jgi:hypothetical protein
MSAHDRDLLHRVRDEIYDGYIANPSSVIYHAMLLRAGKWPSPEDEARWWQLCAALLGLRRSPVEGTFATDRGRAAGEWNNAAGQKFFAAREDVVLLERYVNQAERAVRLAASPLRALGLNYLRGSYLSAPLWCLTCYFLAWDFGDHVPYDIESVSERDDRKTGRYFPVHDFASYERWERGELDIADGNYFFRLSTDIRIATVNAIDAVLSLAEGRGDGRAKQRRLVAHLDVHPPFISLDGKPFSTFPEVGTHFVARLIEANGERVSFRAWVRENPRFVGAVSNRVKKDIPEPLLTYIEWNGGGKPPRLCVELMTKV